MNTNHPSMAAITAMRNVMYVFRNILIGILMLFMSSSGVKGQTMQSPALKAYEVYTLQNKALSWGYIENEIRVGDEGWTQPEDRSFIKFPLSSIPNYAVIHSVRLYMRRQTYSLSTSHRTKICQLDYIPTGSVEDNYKAMDNSTVYAQGNWLSIVNLDDYIDIDLGRDAANVLQSDLGYDFCIGLKEDGDDDSYAKFYGLGTAYCPYIIINYTIPFGVTKIEGASSVNMNSSSVYTLLGTRKNGQIETIPAYNAEWSVSSPYASINNGVLSTSAVPSDQTCVITATYDGLIAQKSITIKYVPPVVDGIAISGPTSFEGNTTYSLQCIAHYDNGSTRDVTTESNWNEDSPYASFPSKGKLAITPVTSNQSLTISVSYDRFTASEPATIEKPYAEILTISGPSAINEKSSGSYVCKAEMSDGTKWTVTKSAYWETNSSYATVSADGIVTTTDVPSDESCLITAWYDGISDDFPFTIKDIPVSYTVSVSSNPSNGGSTSGGGNYTSGSSVTVSAAPAANYTFVNWTENGSQVSTNASYSFTAAANRTLVANFRMITYNVTTSSNPTSGGTTSGAGTYNSGSSATISAAPSANYHFVNWTENGSPVSSNATYSFVVSGNRSFVANFQADEINYTVSTSSNPSNGGSVSGGGTFKSGTTATLIASPAANYSFVNWTENGSQVSTNASYSFTVTGNRTLVANFRANAVNYTVSVSSSPSNGGSVSGGGNYTSGSSVTVSASPAPNYTFLNWTENGSQVSTNASYSFTVTGNRTLVANFRANAVNYTVSVSSSPSNGGSVSGGGSYTSGSSVTVSASPAPNYTFLNWTENGSLVSANASYSFTVTGNRTLVANFQANAVNYAVSVSSSPSNGGSVSGGGNYTSGSSVTVSASPAPNYTFLYWTENGSQVSTNASYSFTVTGNRTLVANFQANAVNYAVSISSSPSNGGSVSGGGSYVSGSSVTVSASPAPNYTFLYWTENGSQVSTNASYSFTVTGNRTLVANFRKITYNVTTSSYPTAGGTTSGTGTYNSGSSATITAVPSANYHFVNWTENGSTVSSSATYSFVVNGNRSFVANFQANDINYTISASSNPSAGGSVSGGGTFKSGTTATLIATPATNYSFVNWTENGSQVSTNTNYTFSVNSNRTLIANFRTYCNDSYEPNDDYASTNTTVFASNLGSSEITRNVSGTVFPADDYDFYRINVTTTGTLTVNMPVAPYNYSIQLYDGNKNYIGISKAGDQAKSYQLSATGYYYIIVSSFPEMEYSCDSYTIAVNWKPTSAPILQCTPSQLTFGDLTINTTSAAQNYLLSGSNLTGNVSVSAPEGFQLSTSGSGTYSNSLTIIPANGAVNTNIYVRFQPTELKLYGNNISNSSNGAPISSVNVSGKGINCIDSYEPNDDYETTNTSVFANNLGTVSFSKTISGTVYPADDYDFYRIKVTHPGTLTIRMPQAPSNYSIQLRDANGRYYGIGMANEPSKSFQISATGNYDIIVSSYPSSDFSCSSYNLNVDWAPLSTCSDFYEPNTTWDEANTTLIGNMGSTVYSKRFGGTIDNINDRDFFVLNMSSTGTLYAMIDNPPVDLDLELYNSDYVWVTGSYTDGSENFSSSITKPGKYYLIIANSKHVSSCENYNVDLEWNPGTFCADPYEPNNSSGNPSQGIIDPLGASVYTKTISSTIHASDDWDYYLITTTREGNLTIEMNNPPVDYKMELWNSDRNVVASSSTSGSEKMSYYVPAAGTYFLRVVSANGGFSCSNYNLDTKWNPVLSQNISFNPLSGKTYGDPDFDLSATTTSGLPVLFSSDNLSVATIAGNKLHITGAGECTITASQIGNSSYAPAENVTHEFAVNKAVLTAIAENKSRRYGSQNPALTVVYSGFVNNEDISVIDVCPMPATSANITSDRGTYPITLSEGIDNNYVFSLVHGTLIIDKATVTALAEDKSRDYGYVNPDLTIHYDGFVNDENYSVLDELPVANTIATISSNVGSYPIILSGGSDNNYEINLLNGTLRVNKTIVTATAENQTRIQGEENPEFTINYSGLVNGENSSVIDNPPDVTCLADHLSNAGDYPIIVSGGSDNNYEFEYVNGILTITGNPTGTMGIVNGNIDIFPVPFNNLLNLRLHFEKEGEMIIRIIDGQGKSVFIKTFSFQNRDQIETLDLSSIPPGIYHIQLKTDSWIKVNKIVKLK